MTSYRNEIRSGIMQTPPIIWKVDRDSLTNFIEYLNNLVPSIKFTHEISQNAVNLLDTTVMKDKEGNINTDMYQKSTNTHPYVCRRRN